MAESLDDGEFWLPPQFLTDDDLFFDKKRTNSTTLTPFKSSPVDDFASEATRLTEGNFPLGFPYGFDIYGGRVSSDISSLVESAEHSDQEDLISYKMAGCFNVESGLKGNVVGEKTMGWTVSGSPLSSPLCGVGSDCSCMKSSSRGSHFQCSNVSSPLTTWDLLNAAVGEARVRIDNEGLTQNINSRGILGPPKRPPAVPVNLRNSNPDSGHFQKQLIAFQKLQAAQFQQLRQQQLMKLQYTDALKAVTKGSSAPHSQQHQAKPVIQARGRNIGGGSVDLSPNAWPPTQQVQHRQVNSGGMRAVFLTNRSAKKECAGTGVFLPRQTFNSAAKESKKKSACATVLLPAKVVQALKLDEGGQKPQFHRRLNGTFHLNGENTARPRNCNGQKRSLKPQPELNSTEVRLPQDWTY